eukprot:1393551-Amorphochlora_amoeboformis.AAC.1
MMGRRRVRVDRTFGFACAEEIWWGWLSWEKVWTGGYLGGVERGSRFRFLWRQGPSDPGDGPRVRIIKRHAGQSRAPEGVTPSSCHRVVPWMSPLIRRAYSSFSQRPPPEEKHQMLPPLLSILLPLLLPSPLDAAGYPQPKTFRCGTRSRANFGVFPRVSRGVPRVRAEADRGDELAER